eukprot:4606726-Pyramimonas_sp.AAC.1
MPARQPRYVTSKTRRRRRRRPAGAASACSLCRRTTTSDPGGGRARPRSASMPRPAQRCPRRPHARGSGPG